MQAPKEKPLEAKDVLAAAFSQVLLPGTLPQPMRIACDSYSIDGAIIGSAMRVPVFVSQEPGTGT